MTTLAYLVHLIVYELLILIPVFLVVGPLTQLPETLFKGPLGFVLNPVAFVLVPLALVCILGGSWLAHNAARQRVFENAGSFEALESAFGEARLLISFVPGVGKLFRGRPPKRSRFDNPDDRRFE